MNRPPSSHIAAFMRAIRAERRDIGCAARAAGLTFAEAAEVYAYGIHKGRISVHDKGPTERWLEEIITPSDRPPESASGGTGQP